MEEIMAAAEEAGLTDEQQEKLKRELAKIEARKSAERLRGTKPSAREIFAARSTRRAGEDA